VGNSPRRGADTDRRHLLVESLAEIKRQFGRSRRVLRASLRHRLDCAPLVQQVTQHHRGQSRHHRHRVPGANNLALIKKSLGITNLDGVRNLTGWRSCSRRSRRCTLRCCTPPARWCSTPYSWSPGSSHSCGWPWPHHALQGKNIKWCQEIEKYVIICEVLYLRLSSLDDLLCINASKDLVPVCKLYFKQI